ncbi:hypothetical protein OKW23_000619 [Bacilli bacterium PM5-9]|nr:hypothetical protein [Bacilli bacterium PM5-9]
MKKIKYFITMLAIVFSMTMYINANENIIDDSPSVNLAEETEDNLVESDNSDQAISPKLRTFSTTSSTTLTVPKEGLYDKTVDKKDANGHLSTRSFYYKNKLVERRYYTYSSANGYRMHTKNLYWSNGSSIERTRKYAYNSKNEIYNTNTKRFRANGTVDWYNIYEEKVGGKVIELRKYDTTGTYYTMKSFYKTGTGVLYKRDYWKGEAPNRVTHTGNYNSVGSVWVNATYYHYPTNVKKEYITYNGATNNNIRKTSTGYRTDGTKEWHKTYDEGELYQITNYDVTGTKKTKFVSYSEFNIVEELINYYENGKMKEEFGYTGENPNILIYKSIYSEVDGSLDTEWFYDNQGNLIEEINSTFDVDTEVVEKNEINNVNLNIKEQDDKNVVSYIDSNGFNMVVYNKESGEVSYNGESIGELEEVVEEIEDNSGSVSILATKKLVKTFSGSIDLKNVKRVVGIVAVVIAVGVSKSATIATGIANVIISTGIDRVYYTGYVYKTKLKKGRRKYTYKFSTKYNFYKDSKRKNWIGTIG